MDSFRKHLSIAEQQAAKEKKEAEKKKAKADKAKAEQAKKVPEVLADPNKVKPAPIRVSHIVHSTSCGRFALTPTLLRLFANEWAYASLDGMLSLSWWHGRMEC